MPRETTFHQRLAGSAIPIFMVLAWVGCAAHCLHGAESNPVAHVNAGQVRFLTAEHEETCAIVASPMIAVERRQAASQQISIASSVRSVEIAGRDRCVDRALRCRENDSNSSPPDLYILLQNFRT